MEVSYRALKLLFSVESSNKFLFWSWKKSSLNVPLKREMTSTAVYRPTWLLNTRYIKLPLDGQRFRCLKFNKLPIRKTGLMSVLQVIVWISLQNCHWFENRNSCNSICSISGLRFHSTAGSWQKVELRIICERSAMEQRKHMHRHNVHPCTFNIYNKKQKT